jgi:hypothetical protein
MKKFTLYVLSLSLFCVVPAFGQFDILKKIKEKAKEATKPKVEQPESGDAPDANKKNSSTTDTRMKKPVNTGVEMVFTNEEYKNFDEAKAHSVNRVVDGDLLWLYIKFRGTLADYVSPTVVYNDDDSDDFLLFTEIGEAGTDNMYKSDTLFFRKQELNGSELKLNLAPGKPGQNKSLPFFLDVAAGGSYAVRNNEIRISNSPDEPRIRADYLATAAITCDVSRGLTKYKKMKDDFETARYLGVAEENKLPKPTDFNDPALKASVIARLKTVGITPVKFYFTREDWEIRTVEPTVNRPGEKYSKMYAAYTYKKGAECLFGYADIQRNYSYAMAAFSEPIIELNKGFPILCEKLK